LASATTSLAAPRCCGSTTTRRARAVVLVPLCRAANLSGLQGPHGAAHCRWSKDHLKSQIRRPFNALSLCVRRQICSWLDVRACRARAPRALPCYQAAESRRAPRRRCPTTSTATTTRWTRTCLARSRRCALTRACRGAGSTATSTSTWRARPRARGARWPRRRWGRGCMGPRRRLHGRRRIHRALVLQRTALARAEACEWLL